MIDHVYNDYGLLKAVVVTGPDYLQITNPYNLVQVDKELVRHQYDELCRALRGNGVDLVKLPLTGAPDQVFARDIGFVIGDILFISKMSDKGRVDEPKGLVELAKRQGWKYHCMENYVEGGDVLPHDEILFLGISDRTDKFAAQEIKEVLNNAGKVIEIVPVLFDKSLIHIDCVFNVLDRDSCLITDFVFNPEDVTKHFKKVIPVPKKDAQKLAANIINLGNARILCNNGAVAHLLEASGFQPIIIEFSEFVKAGGSLGCTAMPLVRDK